MNKNIKHQKGITLIALVITIIVLIILAGVTIGFISGEDGIIAKAQLASFATEMQQIKENVVIKQSKNAIDIALGEQKYLFDNLLSEDDNLELKDTLKQEVLYVREGYPSDKTPKDYNTEEFDTLLQGNTSLNNGDAIYIIDKETAGGKENTYIYDMRTNVVFKIPQTKIAGKIYHSYEVSQIGKGTEDEPKQDEIMSDDPIVIQVGEEYYYSPNMKGFSKNDTKLIYYSEDFETQVEIPVSDYINAGQLNEITQGSDKYILHDYGSEKQIWANVKTTGNGLEAWWVWIPRYAYKITYYDDEGMVSETQTKNGIIDVIYIDLQNKPLNPMHNGNLPEGFIPHTAFTTDKELYGIWMSKFEPSNTFDYMATSSDCYAPDMTGFDINQTYIELYNKNSSTFTDVLLAKANLATINNNNTWYDYKNQVWANVKTTGNGIEAWWVWIPRYAYQITEGVTEVNIIFIDLNNKPMDKDTYGDTLPEGYIVHPAFRPSGEDGNKDLKGIWMSKYEPSNILDYKATASDCYAPDMTGFDINQTYIELYDKENNDFKEVRLSEANLETINNNKTWYDYKNKIWANVKTTGNGLEAWWVWIPRYAYQITETITEANIIFVDLDNKPINKTVYGNELPEGYIVHPAFTPSGEDGSANLKGIWMSKYEPSWISEKSEIQIKSGTTAHVSVKATDSYQYCYNMRNSTSTLGNNSLDPHLTLNADWGATAYLGVSAYGSVRDIDGESVTIGEITHNSTTNNITGVMDMGKTLYTQTSSLKEGYSTASNRTNLENNANTKYVEIISPDNAPEYTRGQAIGETGGWHSSLNNCYTSTSHVIVIRRYILGYTYGYSNSGCSDGRATSDITYRPVIWNIPN